MPLSYFGSETTGVARHTERAATLPSTLTLIHPLFLLGIRRVSSSNVAHFLPDTHKHIHQAELASPTPSAFFANAAHASSSPSSISVSVNPSQRIPALRPPRTTTVAYIPISISIIAGELPASWGTSQGCGLQMVSRRYFRFRLLPAHDAYSDVSPFRAIFRYLLVDFLSFLFPPPLFSTLDFHRRFVSTLSFRLIPP